MKQPRGWDERDYKLWSAIWRLPSYGLIAGRRDNPLVALQDVIAAIEKMARERKEKGHD